MNCYMNMFIRQKMKERQAIGAPFDDTNLAQPSGALGSADTIFANSVLAAYSSYSW